MTPPLRRFLRKHRQRAGECRGSRGQRRRGRRDEVMIEFGLILFASILLGALTLLRRKSLPRLRPISATRAP